MLSEKLYNCSIWSCHSVDESIVALPVSFPEDIGYVLRRGIIMTYQTDTLSKCIIMLIYLTQTHLSIQH